MDRFFGNSTLHCIRRVGVAIKLLDGDQCHVGVLYRADDSSYVAMLHLAWHHDLRRNRPDGGYYWVDPAIPTRRLVQVAALCRKIWRENQRGGIPYAFSNPRQSFDDMGAYLLGPTQLGLTCATFVLGVFDAAGLQLVHYETWPTNRDGDAQWQQRILDALIANGASQDHIAAVKCEIGTVRYRPEEVAGAVTVIPLPASFEAAAEQGNQIMQRLKRLG